MLQRFVERGKETVLAILEDLIERAARDTRAADDIRDAYVRSATLGDLLYHRGEHTRALQLSYLLVPVRVSACARLGMPTQRRLKRTVDRTFHSIAPRRPLGRRLSLGGHLISSSRALAPCAACLSSWSFCVPSLRILWGRLGW